MMGYFRNGNRNRLTLSITLIFGIIIFAGYLVNRLLLKYGLHEVVFRNVLVLSTGYAVFFVAVKLWLRFVSADASFVKDVAMARDAELLEAENKPEKVTKSNDRYDFLIYLIPDELALLIIVPLILVCIPFFFDVAGTWILADVIFDVALATGLIRTLRKIDREEWENRLLKKTILIFLAILFLTSIVLFVMDQKCPNQSNINDMIKVCWS